MIAMILKMSGITLLYVLLTWVLWHSVKGKNIEWDTYLGIGIIYGFTAILSTHFGVDYGDMILNVRDLGPMIGGLFFDPIAGITAGLIGGFERYIAGAHYGVGSFTTVACSISTCFAGFFAAFMNIHIFNRKKPSVAYALFLGAVIEVFHMYVVFISHRDNMEMAFKVVFLWLCALRWLMN
jgi:LytS/YehU family sensor histidine kinase